MNDKDLLQAGYRYALSLRASATDAEDLVQEAWYRLYRHDGRVAGKGSLFTAIRNIYVDRYRREQLVVIEPLDAVAEPADQAADPIAARLAARDLEAPLASLGAAEREALFLNVVEGYTAREIGTFTGRPRGTVLSLIHRAKRKLRGAIEAQAGDDAASGIGGSSQ
ncbi:MAG: RNA polymerase sigma factor [Alphaproteobacteria bacterium]